MNTYFAFYLLKIDTPYVSLSFFIPPPFQLRLWESHWLLRYTEVSCLQLIWLSRKWQVIVGYRISLFSVFPSFKYLYHSSFVSQNAEALKPEFFTYWPLNSPFAINLCRILLYKLLIWTTEHQIMQTCDYLKRESMIIR